MDYKQRWVIDQKNRKRWLDICPTLSDASGIYILTREENGFKWAYIGQAKKLLTRLAEHLRGYQHIDLSLKKHGLWSDKNSAGWSVDFIEYPISELDKQEQAFIKEYANMGYQLRNKTGGGQVDKVGFEQEQTNGYYKGVAYGRQKQLQDVKVFFDKYLDYSIKGKPNKIKERKLKEWEDLIK